MTWQRCNLRSHPLTCFIIFVSVLRGILRTFHRSAINVFSVCNSKFSCALSLFRLAGWYVDESNLNRFEMNSGMSWWLGEM